MVPISAVLPAFLSISAVFLCSWHLKHQLLSDEIYAVILKDETVVREIPLQFCPCLGNT